MYFHFYIRSPLFQKSKDTQSVYSNEEKQNHEFFGCEAKGRKFIETKVLEWQSLGQM